jgi:hypothetical protein
MRLRFNSHVAYRMRRRRIPAAAIYHVVGDADRVIERDDGRTEYYGAWDDRDLLIVTEGEAEPFEVVTVIDRKQRRTRR